jgi:5-oxoprolinase (ATP-hydrolysing)
LFYVGSRGHHADIGGITPGSMPPFSKNVEEEGVLIDNVKLVEGGGCSSRRCARCWRGALSRAQPRPEHRRPARAGRRQREGRAGAAPHGGALRARRRARLHGPRAGQRRGVRAARDRRPQGRRVRLRDGQRRRDPREDHHRADRRSATIDFTGTSPQLESNFNAPTAVVYAAGLLRVPHRWSTTTSR